MLFRKVAGVITLCGLLASARAELPGPPTEMASWKMPWGTDVPGEMSADMLLDKPAGKHGPVVARDGHFYSGNQRLRFWGVNIAFSGNLPTHSQADEVAGRLAHFGINAVRIHHADMFAFPNGLFADDSLDKLSPEALDRLDYFVAALKAHGIYSDLNLHVSRWWSKAHHWENADKTPEFDKIIGLYDPRLIAADKQYARDLLTHVNVYTHLPYAAEPSVCFVEINNENTMFYWGGERKIAEIAEPYGSELTKLWNQWLAKKYRSRDALKQAWAAGVQSAGPNLLNDPAGGTWKIEIHEPAKAAVQPESHDHAVQLKVTASDGTGWHVQFHQPGLKLSEGREYSLSFNASADEPTSMGFAVSQAHEPWKSLGLQDRIQLPVSPRKFKFAFTCPAGDDDARVSFHVGEKVDVVHLSDVQLTEGGAATLADNEDPIQGTVPRGYPNYGYSPARLRDWYRFVQEIDQAYFVEMRRFLKEDVGVKCPVTGTIGLGPLGTLSQSHMDFVDAHAYWDHPQFTRGSWSNTDWIENNRPMVDNPSGGTLWGLAATRVADKPFTVTEYNHSAPNDWQAECVPMIATYAALQDWDAVFLFAYSHDNNYQAKDHTVSFFDFEGNPLKMELLPAGARIFLGNAAAPLAHERTVHASDELMLETASTYYWDIWPFARDVLHVTTHDALSRRLYLNFEGRPSGGPPYLADTRVSWTSDGPDTGTGRFVLRDARAAVFVGFAHGPMPVDLGQVRIEKLQTPFVALTVVPQQSGESIAHAKCLLVTAVARGGNTGTHWDATRHTVRDRWGSAPPLVEIVHTTISITGDRPLTAYALTPQGTRGAKVPSSQESGRTLIELGSEKTICYELVRW